MRIRASAGLRLLLFVLVAGAGGCTKKPAASPAAAVPLRHEHRPPHGGTPVVLGDEVYHVELVRDADTGRLQAFVFDGELENFVRSTAPSLSIATVIEGTPRTLVLQAVANPATGETVGDTAQFETQADWLKTTAQFDGVLQNITIRGTTFTAVKFNFPKGNDKD